MDQVLYGIDYIEYYFYWIYYKFIGYPLIIRICSIAEMCIRDSGNPPPSCLFESGLGQVRLIAGTDMASAVRKLSLIHI